MGLSSVLGLAKVFFIVRVISITFLTLGIIGVLVYLAWFVNLF